MCKILFIGNYKGGVGKTTTVINLARYMFEQNKRVLTLDLDPQCSLSEIQLGMWKNNKPDENKSFISLPDNEYLNYIYDLTIQKIKKYPSLNIRFSDKLIKSLYMNNEARYDFIPSSIFYKGNIGLDKLAIMMNNSIEYLSILKSYVDEIKNSYDYILIDCPPSSNLITQSAFLMSDYYIIPTIPDSISTKGVPHYIKTVNSIYKNVCENGEDSVIAKHYFNECPKLLGVFYSLIRNANYDSEIVALEKLLNPEESDGEKIKIYNNRIRHLVCIGRNAADGDADMEYRNLCQEILNDLENN